MERIPILRMGNFLLVRIQVDMHDQLALTLQNDLTAKIADVDAKGFSWTSPRSRSSTPSYEGYLSTLLPWRGYLTHRPWWLACNQRWPSRLSSWGCPCQVYGPRVTLSLACNISNQELLKTLAGLKEKQDQLADLNQELEDTNRGVAALYAELEQHADDLRRVSDLKASFLSNLSDELRTRSIGSLRSAVY